MDENKTDYPRWWKLTPGVPEVLAAWRDVQVEPKASDLVFEQDDEIDLEHLAVRVRDHLVAAGVDRREAFF